MCIEIVIMKSRKRRPKYGPKGPIPFDHSTHLCADRYERTNITQQGSISREAGSGILLHYSFAQTSQKEHHNSSFVTGMGFPIPKFLTNLDPEIITVYHLRLNRPPESPRFYRNHDGIKNRHRHADRSGNVFIPFDIVGNIG